ncbi:MAG: hypothetical protein A2Y40_05895 [Candidatus Margulisbacteria bacterium GWF2_35_9]|nr:MAG: hypothetical protein A2Y40_05895 [Candidatus Margulisbacteria bacterium GWF2_35_9]
MFKKLVSVNDSSSSQRIEIINSGIFSVGVDEGGTSVSGGLFDDKGALVKGSEFKFKTTTINNMGSNVSENDLPYISAKKIAEQTDRFKDLGAQITNLGISFAGPVNKQGIVIKGPNIFGPNLENIPFAKIVADATKINTGVANDMVAAGFGQMKWGAAKGLPNFLIITVSSGIGANAFLDLEPVIGSNGMAGEIGHLPVFRPEESERARHYFCGCGKWGHLEAISSGNSAAVITLNKAINYFLRNDSRIKSSSVLSNLNPDVFKYAQLIANDDESSPEIRENINRVVGEGSKLGDWFTQEIYDTVIPPVAQALVSADIFNDMDKVVLVGSYGLKMPGYIQTLNLVLQSYLATSGFAFKANSDFANNLIMQGVDMRAEQAAATIPWQVSL